MSGKTMTSTSATATEKVVKARRAARLPQLTASREAQRFAAVILEVLAGVRTPADAATALGVSPPRYYLWEQRALGGLVMACEPREQARGPRPQTQIAALQKEVTRLKQECGRQQALVRAAQRTIGLTPSPTAKAATKNGEKTAGKSPGKKPRKRRAAVRALKAATALRTAASEAEAADSSSAATPGVLQQMTVSPPATCVPAEATVTSAGS